MKNAIRNGVVGFGVACLLSTGALAQDIVSTDGEWRASLDTNGTGQLINLFDNGGTRDNLFETLWYEASDFTGGFSRRIETFYNRTSSNIGANSASFSLMRSDGTVRLDVDIDMISGTNGGALFSLTWTNMGPRGAFKPFAYLDLDVNASAGGDDAMFDVASMAIIQTDDPVTIYFGSTQNYKSWEIQTFSGLRQALDGGRSQLTNSGRVINGDATSALSGALVILDNEDSMSFTFLIGGLAPAPGAIALLGLAGLARTRRRR